MAGPNDSPTTAVRVDPGALNTFANTLRGEADTIGKLNPGLTDAGPALPGTEWAAACQQAADSVGRALQRIGGRLVAVADSVQQAGKALELTDEQFSDTLRKVAVQG
ncbi:hypothetical protein [Nocardia sp. BMG51109]|uniref:hypothetical protein n=1 Tax=Nocardia sp. BMG51109 TaxID=1056816 RepID=UPI00046763BA|nr:hypothetical protein [Nocardia sp. BMG51109]